VNDRDSLQPGTAARRSLRQRLRLRDELLLAFVPTATVLIVFAAVEALSNQRLLFASLASSAFLIYLDPEHGTNRAFAVFGHITATLASFFIERNDDDRLKRE
jgi:hypothetical protein